MNLRKQMRELQEKYIGASLVVYATPRQSFNVKMGTNVTFSPMKGLMTSGIVVCRIDSIGEATYLREATETERLNFIKMHARETFIVSYYDGLAVCIGNDKVAAISVDNSIVRPFMSIRSAWVGRWIFAGIERDNQHIYLGLEYEKDTPAEKLSNFGLTKNHIAAYILAKSHAREETLRIQEELARQEALRVKTEQERRLASRREAAASFVQRAERALSVHNASLVSHSETNGVHRLVINVPGYSSYHAVTVSDDLVVQNSGICLSGNDRRHDLSALPYILRERE